MSDLVKVQIEIDNKLTLFIYSIISKIAAIGFGISATLILMNKGDGPVLVSLYTLGIATGLFTIGDFLRIFPKKEEMEQKDEDIVA